MEARTLDELLKEIKVVFDLVDFESGGGVLTTRLDDIICMVTRLNNLVADYSLSRKTVATRLDTTVRQIHLLEKIYKFHRVQVRPCAVGMCLCVCVCVCVCVCPTSAVD
jgi:hypothetical protein